MCITAWLLNSCVNADEIDLANQFSIIIRSNLDFSSPAEWRTIIQYRNMLPMEAFFLFCLRVKLQSRIKTTVGTYKGEDEMKIVHKMVAVISMFV